MCAPCFDMAAEPTWRWMASAVVVLLLAQLAYGCGRNYYQFEVAVGEHDWCATPRHDVYEPNYAVMMAKHSYNLEGAFDLSGCSGGGCVELQALVVYEEFVETLSSNGCSWTGRCCESKWSRWIGTAVQVGTMQGIGTFAQGIWSPTELAMRIGPLPTTCPLDQCMRHG